MSILPTNAHFQYSINSAKQYCIFRFKQEQEFASIKQPLDQELDALLQDILEEGISKRNVNNHRVIYEKTIQAQDFTNPNEIITIEQKAENIFRLMLNDFDEHNNFAIVSKSRYIAAEQLLLNYFKRYFEIQDFLDVVKLKHRNALNELTDDITSNAVPKSVLVYSYKRLKADLEVVKNEGDTLEALNYYDNLYAAIRADLIKEVL